MQSMLDPYSTKDFVIPKHGYQNDETKITTSLLQIKSLTGLVRNKPVIALYER